MQIPVNKDINEYKDDFFKGMTLKQTVMCALTLGVGAGCYFLCNGMLGLPQTISLYLVFPAALPFAAAGFLKIDGLPPLEYLKRRRAVTKRAVYRYRPLVFEQMGLEMETFSEKNLPGEECGGSSRKEQEETDNRRQYGNTQQPQIKRKDRKYLLGPYEEDGVTEP
ncbi:MAG: PrgI family protein [Lachnospiraceae bacterium]|nr:PrgI family protein [Lachnospiraceae bacterium]